MKSSEQKGVSKITIYLFILIAALLGLYIWQNLHPDTVKVNNPLVAGEQTENTENGDGIKNNGNNDTPGAGNENKGEDVQNVLLFLDKNRNNIKDSNEESCDVCVAKNVLASIIDQESHFLPESSQIKKFAVVGAGNLNTENMSANSSLWGVYEDRKAIIPVVDLSKLTLTNPLNIPVWELSSSIGAINAAIQKISSDNNRTVYVFSQMIPAMENSLEKNQEVWVQFTPDLADPETYYLSLGKIALDTDGSVTGIADSYYLAVEWNFSKSNAKVLKKENLRLHFLK